MADISYGSLSGNGLYDTWGSALQLGADNSFITPRTSDTVTTNAVDGGQPIDNSAGSGWTSFFQDLTKTIVGYSIAKDATRSGIQPAANASQSAAAAPAPAPAAAATPRWLVPAVIAGGALLVYVAVRKG